jgi:hypothetical protein
MTLAMHRKYIPIILLTILAIASLLPITATIAQNLGGFVSVKTIGTSLTNNSQLFIGNSNTPNSWLSLGLASEENQPNPYINPNSGEYALNSLIPLVLMGMFILMLLVFLAREEMNVASLIIAVVLIYMFYAFLPQIQMMITGLLGG